MQGESGFYEVPVDLAQKLRALCDEHGILLTADEVQSGSGRTGALFAMEHTGVTPDLTTMAKGLAGGMPLSAVTGRADVMDHVGPGCIGGTYGGNPMAIAASLAVQAHVPTLVDVRGPGFMNAAEFRNPHTGAPRADLAGAIKDEARARGVILLTCGVDANVIRFLAPLTIPQAVMDEALDFLDACIVNVCEVHDV